MIGRPKPLCDDATRRDRPWLVNFTSPFSELGIGWVFGNGNPCFFKQVFSVIKYGTFPIERHSIKFAVVEKTFSEGFYQVIYVVAGG